MPPFFKWLEQRTGLVSFLRDLLGHSVPGGPSWRHVTGSLVLFLIGLEAITGLTLSVIYAPSLLSAWESVYYVQDVLPGGWLVRGLHHWGAQLLPLVLAWHGLHTIFAERYRAPREVVWWLALVTAGTLLAASFTGYVLPWDRRGYMATQVASGLAANVPLAGPWLRELFLGGAQPSQATLTRIATLHTQVLPGTLLLLLLALAVTGRRAGQQEKAASAETPAPPASVPWWPAQAWRNAAACCGLLLLLLVVTVLNRGADLQAPAELGEADPAARPEWYFLYLYRLLHWEIFSGARQIIPAMVLPALVLAALASLPWLARGRWGARLAKTGAVLGVLAWLGLTGWEVVREAHHADHQAALRQSEADAARARELARQAGGLPPGGIRALLAEDAATQGPRLFAATCASCHPYDGHNGRGQPLTTPPSAADLAGFGSRQWLREFLDPVHLVSDKYWGQTAFVKPPEGVAVSKMVKFVTEDVADYDAEKKQQLEKVILALSAEAQLPAQRDDDARDATLIAEGRQLLGEDGLSCTDCHAWGEETSGRPDLRGWGSREWLLAFLHDPAHDRFYGKRNDRMPAYGAKEELTRHQLELLVDWLRGEYLTTPPAKDTPAHEKIRREL